MNKIIKRFQGYILNLILVWMVVLLYRNFPYYTNFLRSETQTTILFLALGYTVLGFIYYLFVSQKEIKKSKGGLILSFFKKLTQPSKINKQETTALLFIVVKIFFLPIMLNFVFSNYYSLQNQIPNILGAGQMSLINLFSFILFPFLLAIIFFIDTLWFSFGYTFESSLLKNSIKSVEPTIFGWVVALACYPPFNGFITKYLNWYANEYILFFNEQFTFIIRVVLILLLSIYVSATIALGAKCSNLTNRGIVSRGPYSIIRHPAYISKNLAWWFTIIPIASLPAIISMGAWSFIYHLRTITEERHLKKDPDYIEYCKKVKYRYIPGIY